MEHANDRTGRYMSTQAIGIAAALLSAGAWAVGAVLYKKFGERISSVGMNLAKGAINVVLFALTLSAIGYAPMSADSFLLLGISGIIGIALGDTLFFEALQKLGPQVLVVLSMLGQVITALFALFFLGESLSPAMWAGMALVIGGIAFVVATRSTGATRKSTAAGLLCGLGAVLAMSVSVVLAKEGMTDVSAVQATFVRMIWGTAGLLLWGAVRGGIGAWVEPFREVRLAGKFFFLVCLVSFGGFWLFHIAIKYTEVAVATTLSSTEPLFVIPLAAVFLKERITGRMMLGTAVAVAGIVLLSNG